MLGAKNRTGGRAATATAIAATAALFLATAGCGAAAPKNKDHLGTDTTIAAGHRKPFPALAGTTLDGAKLDLASYKGQVVVVNLWASWCESCQAEAPYLEHAYQAFKGEGVQFVGVDTRDNGGQGKAFVQDNKIGYPNLVDDTSETLLTRLVGITSLGSVPSTLIIDRHGDLAWRSLKPVDYTELSAALNPVIAE
ncbi:MAG TPA: TlpA disulfide reductase family protein [Streptomyces sp.]